MDTNSYHGDAQVWADAFAALAATVVPEVDTDDTAAWDDADGEPVYIGTHRRVG